MLCGTTGTANVTNSGRRASGAAHTRPAFCRNRSGRTPIILKKTVNGSAFITRVPTGICGDRTGSSGDGGHSPPVAGPSITVTTAGFPMSLSVMSPIITAHGFMSNPTEVGSGCRRLRDSFPTGRDFLSGSGGIRDGWDGFTAAAPSAGCRWPGTRNTTGTGAGDIVRSSSGHKRSSTSIFTAIDSSTRRSSSPGIIFIGGPAIPRLSGAMSAATSSLTTISQ